MTNNKNTNDNSLFHAFLCVSRFDLNHNLCGVGYDLPVFIELSSPEGLAHPHAPLSAPARSRRPLNELLTSSQRKAVSFGHFIPLCTLSELKLNCCEKKCFVSFVFVLVALQNSKR